MATKRTLSHKELGGWIRRIREEEYGMSYIDFSREVLHSKVSHQSIKNLEDGLSPRYETLVALATELNLDIHEVAHSYFDLPVIVEEQEAAKTFIRVVPNPYLTECFNKMGDNAEKKMKSWWRMLSRLKKEDLDLCFSFTKTLYDLRTREARENR
ncbi:MAG: helix-turn-helix domain-containing protein [Actinomycetota bacterium]